MVKCRLHYSFQDSCTVAIASTTRVLFFWVQALLGGPLPVANKVITPISRVISYFTPVTHLFSAIYRGYTFHPHL